MSYFQISEAPRVHIEVLPDNTKAVNAEYHVHRKTHQYSTNEPNTQQAITITAWTSSDVPMQGTSSMNDEVFVDNYCCDCPFHCEELEVDGEGIYTEYDGQEVELRGTCYAYSPCPCYTDGLGEVSWPCIAGHNIEELGEDAEDIDLNNMFFAVRVAADTSAIISDYAGLQKVEFINNTVYSTEEHPAVNCYAHDNHICWGGNIVPNTLNGIAQAYSATPANQDLTEFDVHNGAAQDLLETEFDDPEDFYEIPSATWLGVEKFTRPTALVVATAREMHNAFLLLAASGCTVEHGLTSVIAQLYLNLAVDDDTVVDAWVTDVLPNNTRLLFYSQQSDNKRIGGLGVFLGQVPANFPLPKCNSNPLSLSALAELVSS